MDERWGGIIEKLDLLLNRLDGALDAFAPPLSPDNSIFDSFIAFRWEKYGHTGRILPIEHPHLIDLEDLLGVDYAKEELVRNTRQFAAGRPANNVLLWGERGNGKSSCIKGLLKMFAPLGVRLIEVQRWDLMSLPAIIHRLRGVPFRFILFCDDLSFSEGEADYRGLKTLLEGGIEARPDNVLIYATSNRRHLMPEPMSDNTGTEEIHPEEAVSEKLSLSDRFGLSLGFSSFDQETYLAIVKNYAGQVNLPLKWEKLRREAILWALYSGRRSGRSARQFIDDLDGRLAADGKAERL
jgi:predicted AAA+ superfamily ATPase